MSDLSLPHCPKCSQPEYACDCDDVCCIDCGCKLNKEALECGRDVCFDCYVAQQD
jgi:hypothetical protein